MGTTSLFKRTKYFNWLYGKIEFPPESPGYKGVCKIMHDTEFVWVIGNDENRIADGRNLRIEYLNGSEHDINETPVSFLEVLIGLSERMAFITGDDPRYMAWVLMKNTGVIPFYDILTVELASDVVDILERVIWRTYHHNGNGGFFPRINHSEDQRKVELWYQMTGYIEELRPGLFDL